MARNAHTRRLHVWALALIVAVAVTGCAQEVEQVPEVYQPTNAHAAYLHGLTQANLTQSAMARDWVDASEDALRTPVRITSPFLESGYFDEASAGAVGYVFEVETGQKIEAEVRIETPEPVHVFMDLFRRVDDSSEPAVHVATGSAAIEPPAEGSTPEGAPEQVRRLRLEPLRDGVYVLRVQPELLRSVRYTISVVADASLTFPVAGRTTRAIQSFFGAERDAGRRSHRGVDIFAPRGTPVLAASDGVVTRANTTPVGGHVVWVSDANRNLRLYYAHLDSHSVESGQRVKAGDQLGTVGNTGNAITTPPHLHFGVYARGAVNPFTFLERLDTEPDEIAGDTEQLGAWFRTRIDEADVLAGPFRRAAVQTRLPRHTPVLVHGASARWYRVTLPDGSNGYVAASSTEAIEPLHSTELSAGARVLNRPGATGAVIDEIAPGGEVPVLGTFGEFLFVQTPRGRGWLLSN